MEIFSLFQHFPAFFQIDDLVGHHALFFHLVWKKWRIWPVSPSKSNSSILFSIFSILLAGVSSRFSRRCFDVRIWFQHSLHIFHLTTGQRGYFPAKKGGTSAIFLAKQSVLLEKLLEKTCGLHVCANSGDSMSGPGKTSIDARRPDRECSCYIFYDEICFCVV